MQKVFIPAPVQFEYANLLKAYRFPVKEADLYWQVYEPKKSQGWLLDISVVPHQFVSLLKALLPYLKQSSVGFRIVRSNAIHIDINNGIRGNESIGKAITIFLDDEELGRKLIPQLDEITKEYEGPNILTDFQAGRNVYLRYGAFRPTMAVDEFGSPVALIRDGFGNVFPDKMPTPPVLPPGIVNPYKAFTKAPAPKGMPRNLGAQFFPWKVLQSHIRGSVYQVVYFNRFLMPRFCIVKEGNIGMIADTYGRDVRDRMTWQNKMTTALKPYVLLPDILEEIKVDNKLFLAMEFIPSKSLGTVATDLLDRRGWWALEEGDRMTIIGYLQEILRMISVLHGHGFLHRDINGNNFLVKRNGTIYLIDLELVFDLNARLPDPPFGKGTKGFISPQQDADAYPAVTDDVFSLGSTVLFLLSGMDPAFLLSTDKEEVYRKVFFLVGDEALSGMIAKATDHEPGLRPGLKEMISELEFFKQRESRRQALPGIIKLAEESTVVEVVQQGINNLCSSRMIENKLWFSYNQDKQRNNNQNLINKGVEVGMNIGLAGTLFAASRLRTYSLTELNGKKLFEKIQTNWQFLKAKVVNHLQSIPTGLHFGAPGIGMAMAEMLDTGMLIKNRENMSILSGCFFRPNNLLDVLFGIAGEGLGLIRCAEYLDKARIGGVLQDYSDRILKAQLSSGAWKGRMGPDSREEVIPGFVNGVAGICYFLLEVGSRYNYLPAIQGARKGMERLAKMAKREGPGLKWPNVAIGQDMDWGWAHGNAGIALAFLKAFGVLGEDKYLQTARKALEVIPENMLNNSLSQYNGIAGIGEVYLEMHRVTGEKQWRDRAGWISELLVNLRFTEKDTAWWLVGNGQFPTSDFMLGNTGVLHFLQRYLYPDKMSFPLLPATAEA
jgi:serine/threonine protein kinase